MAVVYKHIRKDTNEVFYVGIGRTDKRPYNFVKRSLHHKNIIKKFGVEVEIICENITWDEACKKEIELIKEYGRIDFGTGNLINRTDGGEGSRNFIFSEEEKNRRSEYAKKQHKEGKINYNKISQTLTDKNLSSDHKKRISEGLKKTYENREKKPKKITCGKEKIIIINKDGKNKGTCKSFLNDYLNNGWELGMIRDGKKKKIKTKKTCNSKYVWISKNLKTKRVCYDNINEYLNSGWVNGRHILKSNKNHVWINNGVKDIMVNQDEVKNYLDLKWNYGRITMKNSKKHAVQN